VSKATSKMIEDIKGEHPTADKEDKWRLAIDGPYNTIVKVNAYYKSRSPVSLLDVRIYMCCYIVNRYPRFPDKDNN
jgi:hypothetical protein